MAYGYRCPGCRTTNAIHRDGCKHGGLADGVIEEAHIDILSTLSTTRYSEEGLKNEAHNGWSPLHDDVLELYLTEGRITHRAASLDKDEDELVLYLRTPAEYRAQLVPTEAHIKTVWERGPVDGCKDSSLVAVVSWHEWKGFDWQETHERVVQWLRDTGAWDRGDWEEPSPEAAVDGKRHVFDGGYGWKEGAISAERIIKSAQAVAD